MKRQNKMLLKAMKATTPDRARKVIDKMADYNSNPRKKFYQNVWFWVIVGIIAMAIVYIFYIPFTIGRGA